MKETEKVMKALQVSRPTEMPLNDEKQDMFNVETFTCIQCVKTTKIKTEVGF